MKTNEDITKMKDPSLVDQSKKKDDYKAAAQLQQMLNGFSIPASAKEQAFKQMKSGLSNKYDK